MMRRLLLKINGSAYPGGNSVLEGIVEEHMQESGFIYDQPENYIIIGLYIPIFLLALVSNLLIILIFVKFRSFRTVTNCFLLNLSIADLLVTILCMPAAIGEAIHSNWLLGEFLCKLTHYLQGVSVSASIFTLTCMSIDRYLAICYPLKRKNFITKRETKRVLCVLWLVALLIFAPLLFVRKTDGYQVLSFEAVYCVETWPTATAQKIVGAVYFTLVFAIPGPVILTAYTLIGLRLRQRNLLPEFHDNSLQIPTDSQQAARSVIKERRKIAKTLMFLAVAFAVCWLPSNLLTLWMDLQGGPEVALEETHAHRIHENMASTESEDFDYEFIDKLHRYFILLGHVNSLLNPLLYTIRTKNFRKHITNLFDGCKSCCNGNQSEWRDESLAMSGTSPIPSSSLQLRWSVEI